MNRMLRTVTLTAMTTLATVVSTVQAAPTIDIPQALGGRWVGTLEYRDYGNDRRVRLPTQLDVVRQGEHEMDLSYVYDDGPGKTVRESSHVVIDPGRRRYLIRSADERDPYRIVEQSGSSTEARYRILLEGRGTENDHAVTIRTSIVRDGDRLSILRESRRPGEPFKFRHQYRFTRVGD